MADETPDRAAQGADTSSDESAGHEVVSTLRAIVADVRPSRCERLVHQLRILDVPVAGTACNASEAVALSVESPSKLALVSATIPPSGCVAAIRAILAVAPETQVVVTFGPGDVGAVAGALDAGAVDIVNAASKALGLALAIEGLSRGPAKDSTAARSPDASLTAAEREVLVAIASGVPQPEIPKVLGISRDTVDSHVRNALRKLHEQNGPGRR